MNVCCPSSFLGCCGAFVWELGMEKCEGSKEKLDRKTTEKNRRIHMKELCFELTSLIPSHHFKSSKDMVSQHDQLDQAVTYINQLKQRVDELQAKRAIAMTNTCSNNNTRDRRLFRSYELPVVELKDLGSIFDVVLITGLEKNFMMHEVIGVLQDEGAEVVSASFSTVGDKVFHTFHAQVKVSRFGVDTSRVYQRLQELIN